MKNINLHPTQAYANELADICRPLEKLNITYFGHAQVNDQGHFAALNNNPQFMHYYLSNNYYNADIHMAQESLGNYVLWDNIELDGKSRKLFHEAMNFGVDHTFTIIEKNVNGMQYYHFASNTKDKSINQEYLRHLDLLKRFTCYFNEQVASSKNLRDAYSSTFSLAADSTGFIVSDSKIGSSEPTLRESFLQQINSQDTSSNNLNSFIMRHYNLVLSKREIDCLTSTVFGKTAKLTADDLGISRRTVEEHLASIKVKLHVFSKTELIEKIWLNYNRFNKGHYDPTS